MRVLFINLNNRLSRSADFFMRLREMQAATNLACLANVVLQARHAVKIIDCDIENTDDTMLMQSALEYKPHVMVIHVDDFYVQENLDQIESLKEKFSGCKFVVHNNYLYHLPDKELSKYKLEAVDVIVREEPDDLFQKLLDFLFDNYPVKKISNVRYKDEKKVWRMTDSVFFNHLDAISLPYRKGLKNDLYKDITQQNSMAIIKASRGSTSDCIYESVKKVEGGKIRTRSPESIAREITTCYNEFGIKDFYLETEDFNHDDNWACDVAYAIRNSDVCGQISLTTKLHLKDLNPKVVEQMNYAGFKLVVLNMVTASDEGLRRSRTGFSCKPYETSLELLHHFGLKTFGIYRIGFPWEMKKHIDETTKMILDFNHSYLDFQILNPVYNCEAVEILKEEGLLGEEVHAKYKITGTKYLKLSAIESMYNSFMKKYKVVSLLKKEKIQTDLYKLSEADKKIKNKRKTKK